LAHTATPPTRQALPASAILPAGHFAGRLRYDTLVNGRTAILGTWLLVTADANVAARAAALLGGQRPRVHRDGEPPAYHLQTDHSTIDVVLDGPQASDCG
jgi:hypothetical protein